MLNSFDYNSGEEKERWAAEDVGEAGAEDGIVGSAFGGALPEELSREDFERILAREGCVSRIYECSKDYARALSPFIWRSLIKAAASGNISAIKLYFDLLGKDKAAKGEQNAVYQASADAEVERWRGELFGGGEE